MNDGTLNQIIGLFPTPFMRVEAMIAAPLLAGLIEELRAAAHSANARSARLAHTRILAPDANPLIARLCGQIEPRLADFGELLFGERLVWSVKEIWGNVLDTGGQQAMHNHANSFISGVLYLTESHPSANTVFMKGPGGREFAFTNAHHGTEQGPFNADKWVSPDAAPGDLVLFPSYLLHEVPPNLGGQRITVAFNAIPERLNAWGYELGFSAAPPSGRRP